jgi:tRNA(Ile)-lysidine synthase
MGIAGAIAVASVPDPARLWHELAPASGRLKCAVAWSGGLDSTVLMHLMVALRRQHPRRLLLRALHVDHHLQPASRDFRAHCNKLARGWRVPLTILDVKVRTGPGVSTEEAAREARYAAWQGALAPGEDLLLAQHADDQVESLLLALLRGAGPAGLAAMPREAALGRGRLVRPLLGLSRDALRSYAGHHALTWVEDPSNQLQRFDRNYLRAEVVPRLRQRWPSLAQTLSRSAWRCGSAAASLAEVAARDLAAASDGAGLDPTVLRRWPADRQRDVLRAWFARAGRRSPETRHLEQIRGMLSARADAHPLLELPEATVRMQQARLLLDAPRGAPTEAFRPQSWRWRRSLALPGGEIAVLADVHGDLDLSRLPRKLTVHAPATAPVRGRSMRKLLQELAVPRAERERLPLLYPEGGATLLAIADLWLHPAVQVRPGSRRRGRIVWRPQR